MMDKSPLELAALDMWFRAKTRRARTAGDLASESELAVRRVAVRKEIDRRGLNAEVDRLLYHLGRRPAV